MEEGTHILVRVTYRAPIVRQIKRVILLGTTRWMVGAAASPTRLFLLWLNVVAVCRVMGFGWEKMERRR